MLSTIKSCKSDKQPNSNIEITVPMDNGFVTKVKLQQLWLDPSVVIELEK